MNPPLDDRSRAQAELKVLRALCRESLEGLSRAKVVQTLKDYAWLEPVHEALFKCLAQIPSRDAEILRSLLPACLTRRGFPDVDWDFFFISPGVDRNEFEKLLSGLRQSPTEAARNPNP
jgi:hypothetical protein